MYYYYYLDYYLVCYLAGLVPLAKLAFLPIKERDCCYIFTFYLPFNLYHYEYRYLSLYDNCIIIICYYYSLIK